MIQTDVVELPNLFDWMVDFFAMIWLELVD